MSHSHRPSRTLRICTLTLTLGATGAVWGGGIHIPEYPVAKMHVTVSVKPDGSYVAQKSICYRVDHPRLIAKLHTEKVSYSAGLAKLKVTDAYTQKPDGRRIPVNPAAIRDQDSSSDTDDGFNDRREVVIVFQQLEVGDRTCYTATKNHHLPVFKGYYEFTAVVNPWEVVEDLQIQLDLPAGYRYATRGGMAPAHAVTSLGNGRTRYAFAHRQTQKLDKEPNANLPSDYAPSLWVSNYHSWSILASVYRTDLKDKTRLTPVLQKQAEQLTRGLTDPRAKAIAIFRWVQQNIRYVSILLGRGGVVPHTASEVLEHRYGDCKDHSMIMEALLQAVGIESTPVLISTDDKYEVPPLTVATAFNHMITYIPSLDIYLDATSRESMPPLLEHYAEGKWVLHVKTGELKQTPVSAPEQSTQDTDITLKIQPDGSFIGTVTSKETGHIETESRDYYRRNQANDAERTAKAIQKYLQANGETGTGKIIAMPDPNDWNTPWIYSAEFEMDPLAPFPGPGALAIPSGLYGGVIQDHAEIRPRKEIRRFPHQCNRKTIIERHTLEFPATVRITHIPQDFNYSGESVSYASQYRQQGNTVQVTRTLKRGPATAYCTAKEHQELKDFHPTLQKDVRQQILYAPAVESETAVQSKGSEESILARAGAQQ